MSDALCMHVHPTLQDAALVASFEGWNDAGEAATYAVRYLADAIRSVPLASIDCEEFLDLTVRRPVVRIGAGGQRNIEWPRTEFAYGSPDGSREIVLGHGIEPHVHWRRYADLVAEVVLRLKIRRAVLLGAYVADVVYSRPVTVTGFATSPQLLEEIGVTPSHYEGPTGIVGVLTDRLARQGVEILSLWAGLPHYISATPNPRGALALLQTLTAALNIKIDDEPLRADAAAFEEKVSAIVSADPELSEYVRQLKRREFAQ
jgi:predicted ATP-grasp superfamily ATP-dependent carboligase